ncbi:MAG: bifunctional chorismate mutase/prephenate dehydratase [Candidatus Aminicenantes bacterium]|nr:bifunctional chorismate mutase/prephenate dehydratase [Candidatus Aminicenantes bacterium]
MPAQKQKERSSASISCELGKIRGRIDDLDARIVRMLTERVELALRAGKLKDRARDSGREAEVLRNVMLYRRDPLSRSFLRSLFRRIIAESRAAEEAHPALIGFQGEHGAYSEEAARAACPRAVPIPFPGFRDIFEGVSRGSLDLGLVPVENSTEGAVAEVNDLLLEFGLYIIRDIRFPIRHQLLIPRGADPAGLKTVLSHPQALAQCRRTLRTLGLEARAVYDTAGAARNLAETPSPATAVIASRLCAGLYRLKIAAENIEDEPSNRTRFLVLARDEHRGPADRVSLAFSTRHETGALCSVLDVFRERGVNLLRIESRPVKSDPGTYIFFIDFAGGPDRAAEARTLAAARKHATYWKFFGGYKEA